MLPTAPPGAIRWTMQQNAMKDMEGKPWATVIYQKAYKMIW